MKIIDYIENLPEPHRTDTINAIEAIPNFHNQMVDSWEDAVTLVTVWYWEHIQRRVPLHILRKNDLRRPDMDQVIDEIREAILAEEAKCQEN